jgi:hypothetical protein
MNQNRINNDINEIYRYTEQVWREVSNPGASAGPRQPADAVLTGMGVRPMTNPSV